MKADWKSSMNVAAFFLVHLACLGALWTGVDAKAVTLMAMSFLIRKFGITGGYHRYFSHKTYRVNRVVQFVIAWIGCSAAQKGPLWWAAHHRDHHLNADGETDLHSPTREGFYWSHIGWILSCKYEKTNTKLIPDLVKFPELVWINKNFLIPPVVWGLACAWIDGWKGVVWGFFISTTILWHTTFLINSAAHLFGNQRFPTTDTSKNNWLLALITMGEGWHNNHHYFPGSTNQGFYWWEIDVTYYGLRFLEFFGITKDLRRPPERILALGREKRKTGRF